MTTAAPDAAGYPAGSVLTGFALAATGILLLPFGDAIAKHLAGQGVHAVQIAWGRWAAHFLLLTPIAFYFHRNRIWWPQAAGLQVIRSALMCVATVAYFTALQFIQLADAAAVLFVAPVMVTALSGLVLGERVGPRRWVAVVSGFAGVLLIVRPGAGVASWGALLALIAAACFSVYFLLTRKIAHRNPPLVTLWFMGAAGSAIMLPLIPPFWQAVDADTWLLIAAIGAIMALGHLLIIQGLQYVEASAIAPLPYLELITATVLGYYWFGEFPGVTTWIGCGVVIIAGLFIAHRERRHGPTTAVAGINLSGSPVTESLDIDVVEGENRHEGEHRYIIGRPGRRGRGVGFMKSILNILAVGLIGAGVAAGVFSFLSPGSVILGLNLGVAATLLTGGFILLGLSGVMGTLEGLLDALHSDAIHNFDVPSAPPRPEPAIGVAGTTGGPAAAGVLASGAARAAEDAVTETADDAGEAISEAATTTADAAAPVLEPVAEPRLATGSSGFEGALQTTKSAAEGARDMAVEASTDAVERVAGAGRRAGQAAGGLAQAAAETASEAAESVSDAGGKAVEAGSNMGEAAADTVRDAEESVAEAGGKAMDAAGDGAEAAADTVREAATKVIDAGDNAAETAGDMAEDASEAVRDVADSTAEVVEDAAETVEDAAEEAAEAVDDVAEDTSDADAPVDEAESDSGPEPEADAETEPEPDVELESEPEAEPEPEGEPALYVIEERTIRGRPARMLSDGTVECETAEGWMRFENLEHLDEYLDAMGG